MNNARKDTRRPESLQGQESFEAERERVCAYFADREGARQGGQLTVWEYLTVGVLLVAAFALVLVLR